MEALKRLVAESVDSCRVREATLPVMSPWPPILFCMRLYRSRRGIVAEHAGHFYTLNRLPGTSLVDARRSAGISRTSDQRAKPADMAAPEDRTEDLLPPIGGQEVWAAGVTYLSQPRCADGGSRKARAAETSTIAFITRPGQNCSSNRRRIAWWGRERRWRSATMLHGPCRSRS